MRAVKTFEHRPLDQIIESETVDLDNRSFGFTVFGNEDPQIVTLILGDNTFTRSRACLIEGMERILDIYEEAVRLTLATGVLHVVDHIIPVNSQTVTGLHVPDNLQILTEAENIKKRNHHETV